MPEEEFDTPKEQEDIYDEESVEKDLEDDEISAGEAGFMEGYDRDLEESEEEKAEDAEETLEEQLVCSVLFNTFKNSIFFENYFQKLRYLGRTNACGVLLIDILVQQCDFYEQRRAPDFTLNAPHCLARLHHCEPVMGRAKISQFFQILDCVKKLDHYSKSTIPEIISYPFFPFGSLTYQKNHAKSCNTINKYKYPCNLVQLIIYGTKQQLIRAKKILDYIP